MFDVEASEVTARWSEVYERIRAGESIRLQEEGREVGWMRGTDPDLMARMRWEEALGRLTIPTRFGERGDYRPVSAVDGGHVGAVEAVIEERRTGP